MPRIPIFQIDAFTDQPFLGNPAAVCFLDGAREDVWMQSVAAEMNLSETAFVTRLHDANFQLRWFTPKLEVDLCGHATLAAAHALWEEDRVAAERTIRFQTKSGELTCFQTRTLIHLDFPATPVIEELPSGMADELTAALGCEAVAVGRTARDILLTVSTEDAVRGISPDFRRLAAVPTRGVIVTSRCTSAKFDFVSRFFAPAAGIDEDSVTGSAHCCLGPYWAGELKKQELIGYQASARGGIVHVRIAGERVTLGGHAVTMMRGELAAVQNGPKLEARN